jgi:hypothetical protein
MNTCNHREVLELCDVASMGEERQGPLVASPFKRIHRVYEEQPNNVQGGEGAKGGVLTTLGVARSWEGGWCLPTLQRCVPSQHGPDQAGAGW